MYSPWVVTIAQSGWKIKVIVKGQEIGNTTTIYLLASKHTQAFTQCTFAQTFEKQQRQAARMALIPINAGRLCN